MKGGKTNGSGEVEKLLGVEIDTKKNELERQEAWSENGMFAAEVMEGIGNWF